VSDRVERVDSSASLASILLDEQTDYMMKSDKCKQSCFELIFGDQSRPA